MRLRLLNKMLLQISKFFLDFSTMQLQLFEELTACK